MRDKNVYKDKNRTKSHEQSRKQDGILYAQKTLADDQRIYRKTNQTRDACRDIAAVNANLNQMDEKVNVAADECAKPNVP